MWLGRSKPTQSSETLTINSLGAYPIIYLVEGRDFLPIPRLARRQTDYRALRVEHDLSVFGTMQRALGHLALPESSLLFAGYNAAHDKQQFARTSTFVMTFEAFKAAVGSPAWLHPLLYTGIESDDISEPAIGVYDRSKLTPILPGEIPQATAFVEVLDTAATLEAAKLAEFQLIRKGEVWRLPQP